MNWYSKPVLMWFLACMLLLLTGCALNTGVNIGLRKSPAGLDSEESSALVLATVIFAVMSGVGWILWCFFAWMFGRGMVSSCTITETTHSLVPPTHVVSILYMTRFS